METRFKWWHPSCRYDKNAGFSVSWIFVFLSGGGIQRRRQERDYTMPIETFGISFFLFLLLLQRTSPK